MTTQPKEQLCVICGRVPFGYIVTLPFARFRHTDCQLGSEEWHLYYHRQDKATKAKLAKFLPYYQEGVS